MAVLAQGRFADVHGDWRIHAIEPRGQGVFEVNGALYTASGKPAVKQAIAPVILGAWEGANYIRRTAP